ncbi:MAG: heme ABC transporter ATP-binding protein [Sphingomonadales bacterium]
MTAAIELREASVIRARRPILNQASLVCQPGQFSVFCGPNGAGKTTAFSVLSGAIKPDAGGVFLGMEPMAAIGADALARRRAVVAQQPVLTFPFLVHEVIAMGRTPHEGKTSLKTDQDIIEHALKALELEHLADRNYLTLSGGERQRVHIARALAQIWPHDQDKSTIRWLLLDEPTSALDLKYEIALMRLLADLARQGWGVVAVLHDLRLVLEYADHVILFKSGKTVDSGMPHDVLTPEAIQSTYDLDAPYAL